MRVCITKSNKKAYSETFIAHQIKGLSALAEVDVMQGGWLPQCDGQGKRLNPFFFHVIHKIIKNTIGCENDWFSLYGIQKHLVCTRPNVVLANYGIAGVKIWKACQTLHLPLIVHFHGFDAYHVPTLEKYRSAYRMMFDYATAIIAVSADMQQQLIKLGAPPEKVCKIPYGVDLQRFTVGNPGLNGPIFLAVGRFTAKKAPMKTMLAFAAVLKKIPAAQLIMVGGKEEQYEDCLALAKRMGLIDKVRFTGVCTPQQIVNLMHQARAFVQHSVVADDGDTEGTPNTILEAAACGLPVVSTWHAGIKEAVVHGETGYLVEEHDVTGMANYMVKLAEDPLLAQSLGIKGRQHIEAHYLLERQIQQLFQILQQAAK